MVTSWMRSFSCIFDTFDFPRKQSAHWDLRLCRIPSVNLRGKSGDFFGELGHDLLGAHARAFECLKRMICSFQFDQRRVVDAVADLRAIFETPNLLQTLPFDSFIQ